MLEFSHSQQGNLMNQFYVHVRLFEATAEQTKKFEELMLNFLYQKTIKESDDSCCRLIPEGYILKSTMNCQQILIKLFPLLTVLVLTQIYLSANLNKAHAYFRLLP